MQVGFETTPLAATRAAIHKAVLGMISPSTPVGPKDEYIQSRLLSAMLKQRGRKRLRKKKAQKALYREWLAWVLVGPIRRRVDYGSVARQVFQVEPLPGPTGMAYFEDRQDPVGEGD
jgi:hypothetical protein